MPDVIDYRQAPLGSMRGEEGLQAPYNQRPTNCLVRVRNLSAVRPRKIIKEFVSIRRGGEKSVLSGPYKGHRDVSVEALRFKVAQGENMNWEVDEIVPTDAVVRHDGRRYLVPHTNDKTGEKAPWINVDPGCWDLYMGNWERMHSNDRRERISEIQQLQGRGLHKWTIGDENPYGFLEFEREEIVVEEAIIDADRVRSGQMMEI